MLLNENRIPTDRNRTCPVCSNEFKISSKSLKNNVEHPTCSAACKYAYSTIKVEDKIMSKICKAKGIDTNIQTLLHILYIKRRLPITKISKLLGCDRGTLSKILKKYNIER